MKAIVEIEIIAPDEVLQAAGETYASLTRDIEIEFLPVEKMNLMFDCDLTDENKDEFGVLFSKVTNPKGIVTVDSVTYDVGKKQIHVKCYEYEETIEGFYSYIEFLKFYHFK